MITGVWDIAGVEFEIEVQKMTYSRSIVDTKKCQSEEDDTQDSIDDE